MTNGPGRIELGRILAGENHAPVVYFARIADKIKIGTTTNLKQRMRSFYLDLSDVLVVVPGGKDVEAAYHKRFGSSRADEDGRQELFRIDHRLAFFLGLWRQSPSSAKRPGLPLDFMPRQELGNCLDLDDELRRIEGGGRGHWNAGTVEKVADIVARMTYLCVTAREDGKDPPDGRGDFRGDFRHEGEMHAYYWNATHEQALAEWEERRSAPLRDQIYLPGRWSWKRGLDSWLRERAIQKLIKAHADRAAIIRDLFVDACRGYQSQGLTEAGRA
jgi:hypothetical protein